MDSSTYHPRNALDVACFDTIAYGNPFPDQVCKDLQCTGKALSDFLDSEECQNQLNLGQKLAHFQATIRAQRHIDNAIETLHEVTNNTRNPMAQPLGRHRTSRLRQNPPRPSARRNPPRPRHRPCPPQRSNEARRLQRRGANVPPTSAHGAEIPADAPTEKIENQKWKVQNRISRLTSPRSSSPSSS